MSAANNTWGAVRARRRFTLPARWRNRVGMIGAAIVLVTIFVALFGRFIWTVSPNAPINSTFQGPSWAHPMGTDNLGRDTFARIIAGAQVALEIGAFSVLIALGTGSVIGLVAGYFRGAFDLLLMRVVDLFFAIPSLVLLFVIVGLLGPSRFHAILGIGIVFMPAFARLTRAAVLEVMGSPYIESGRALGSGNLRIIIRHVIPNIMPPLIVVTSLYTSQAIIAEATLSYLGLGTQPPAAAWGNMLANARGFIDESVWMSVFPGLAIMIAVLGFNFLGDGLRDVLDPRINTALVVTRKK